MKRGWMALALAAWLAAVPAAAQQPPGDGPAGRIAGTIVEARTLAALGEVLVQVASTGQRVESAADGRFAIEAVPAGPQTILVSAVGYGLVRRVVTVVAGETTDLVIPLAEGGSTFDETVTVSASPFRDAAIGVASQSVLGRRDLEALRGLLADDPFRAVQALPGVATGDDFNAQFAIRGLGTRHLGVSIDGVNTPLLFHTVRGLDDSGSLALINTEILDSVSLTAGARPQWTGASLGAGVEFHTRDGSRDRFRARGLASATALTSVVEGPLGTGRQGSWLVAARKSYIDWLLRALDDGGTTATFGFTDTHAALFWQPDPRHSVRVSVLAGRSTLRDRDDDPGPNSLDRGQNRVVIANVRWRAALTPSATLHQQAYVVDASYRNTVLDGRDRERGADRHVTWRGSIDWARGAVHGLLAGAEVSHMEVTRLDRFFTGASTRTDMDLAASASARAVFAGYRWSPSPALSIAPGVRLDHWSVTGQSEGSPWVVAEWAVASGLRVRGGFGVQRQPPLTEEAAAAGDRGSLLRTERVRSADFGVEHRRGDWRANLAYFYRDDTDRLRAIDGDPRLVGQLVVPPRAAGVANVLRGLARGVEFTVERRAPDGWSGWASYAWVDTHLVDVTTDESFPSDVDQAHTINAYLLHRWSAATSISARVRVGSNFPLPGYYRRVGDEYVLAALRNRERLPAYARVDVRADRAFTYRRSRLTLFVEVLNVLGRRNYGHGDPGFSRETGRVVRLTEELFPRLPTAGVLFEF